MEDLADMLHILFVEDDPNDVLLMQRAVRAVWPRAVFAVASTREELQQSLVEMTWSVVIVDYNIPGLPFESALHQIMDRDPNLPAILVSGVADAEATLNAMRSGAWDFIGKDNLSFLPSAIEHALKVALVRRQAESSKLQFERLFHLVPLPVLVYQMGETFGQGHLVEVNQSLCTLLGYEREAVLNHSVLEFIPSSCHPALQANWSELMEEGQASFDVLLTKASGTECSVEVFARKFELNGRPAAVVLVQDFSTRQEAEIRRVRMMSGLQQVVYSAGELLKCPDFDSVCRRAIELGREALGLDRCGLMLRAGEALVGTYGIGTDGDIVDEHRIRMTKEDGWDHRLFKRESASKRWILFEHSTLYAMDGDRYQAIGEGWKVNTPIRDENGNTWAVLMNDSALSKAPYDEDLQEIVFIFATILGGMLRRKEAEDALAQSKAQLRQSQKMEALGRLAGGVAHDFNNLLTSILGYCELISEGLGKGHPFYEDVQEVSHAGRRAAELTQRLLAFSRKQITEVHPVDVCRVITGLENLLARTLGEDIQLKIHIASESGVVMGDEGLIENVLMNLAVNARDAMPTGGVLSICASVITQNEIQPSRPLPSPETGTFVAIEVVDTGCGIDPEILEHIFEPFFTTKGTGSGTGLGLSTVYGIIKQINGYIEVQTEKERGTKFTIYLPCTEQKASVQKRFDAQKLPHGKEVILIVEDEVGVRRLTSRLLSELGYTVLEAGNGGEALMLCEKRTAPIDLVLSDVVMPQLSGPETVQRLLQVRQDFKILYMTGFMQEAIVRKGVVEQDSPVILKPFTRVNLARKVRQVLDAPT